MDNGKRKMTVEEMIVAGAPWEQIQARIEELQHEQKMKEEAAARAQVRDVQAAAARERFVVACVDWMVAEGIVEDDSEEKENLKVAVDRSCEEFAMDIRRAMAFGMMLESLGFKE